MVKKRNATKLRTLAGIITLGLAVVPAVPATADTSTETHTAAETECARQAQDAVADDPSLNGNAPYDFTCLPGTIDIQGVDTNGQISSATHSTSGTQSAATATDISTRASDYCSITDAPSRDIVNELQVNVDYCVVYGQENDPTHGSWVRTLAVEWTVHPGWPSTQSDIRVISSDAGIGRATLWLTTTLQKQNGALPPSDILSAFNESRSGMPANGYFYEGTSTGGNFALRQEDLLVTDFDKQFNQDVSFDTVFTPRFTCDSEAKRCYYPNGAEAPVLG